MGGVIDFESQRQGKELEHQSKRKASDLEHESKRKNVALDHESKTADAQRQAELHRVKMQETRKTQQARKPSKAA